MQPMPQADEGNHGVRRCLRVRRSDREHNMRIRWFTAGVVCGSLPTGVAMFILLKAAQHQAELLAWGCDLLFQDRFPKEKRKKPSHDPVKSKT